MTNVRLNPGLNVSLTLTLTLTLILTLNLNLNVNLNLTTTLALGLGPDLNVFHVECHFIIEMHPQRRVHSEGHQILQLGLWSGAWPT